MRVNVNIDGLIRRFDLVSTKVDGATMYGLCVSFARTPKVRGEVFHIDNPPDDPLMPRIDDLSNYAVTFWSRDLEALRDMLDKPLNEMTSYMAPVD